MFLLTEDLCSLKTGLLKWSADHDDAADYYNKAAVAYKAARMPEKSIQCHVKASEQYRIVKQYPLPLLQVYAIVLGLLYVLVFVYVRYY